uniref:Uncharacterized protein n=1 Tax=Setaria italica TaxID=4555 RepID=K3YXL2_SETIT
MTQNNLQQLTAYISQGKSAYDKNQDMQVAIKMCSIQAINKMKTRWCRSIYLATHGN